MSEIKPIKRSVQLQPLSREHHEGLLFVWKIRKGLENHTPLERLGKYVGWYWKNHIRPHFYQEEKLLIPLMPPLHPLSKRLKEDHEGIRELILSLGRDVERHDLTRLANQIDVHIRFEEREFFQYLEEHLSAQQLSEVYVQLEQHPVACKEEWEDQFWVNK